MTHNWTNEPTRIWHWSDSPKTTVIIIVTTIFTMFSICSWYFLKQNSKREKALISHSLSLSLLELSPLELITKKYVILFIFKFQINVVRTTVNTKGKSLLIMQIFVFVTRFQHAYFGMYSNNFFFFFGKWNYGIFWVNYCILK